MKPFKISSLVKALLLVIPSYGLGLAVIAVATWLLFFLWLILMLSGQLETFPLIGLPIALLAIGFAWYCFAKVIYSLLLRVFWSEPPKLVRTGGVREGLKTYGEILVVSLPLALVFASLIGLFGTLTDARSAGWLAGRMVSLMDVVLIRWFWLWLLSAVGYYHFARK